MDWILQALTVFDRWLWGNWLLFVLLGVGGWYTLISGGVQIWHFGEILKKTLWDPIRQKTRGKGAEGTISSFQALCTAVASCVGSGNIVGVSTAVLAGGMGALFWMWVAAFLGMATKYGEIVLGILYREKDETGNYVGGPMYYIEKGLRAPWLAGLCAGFMVIQIIGGNLIQSNTISGLMRECFQFPLWVTGGILVAMIFLVSAGGLKGLAKVSQKVVPFMAVLYVAGGLVILLVNITRIPGVIQDIFVGAFGLRAAAGGAIGSMVTAMEKGIARGLYSNEAGEGSAPVIHSAAKVNHPVEQGIMGVAEVFVDTFLLCTITGLVLGVTGMADSSTAGYILVAEAFASVWKPLGYVVSFSLILFCVTTLMSQWYFGYVGLNYLKGKGLAEKFKYVFPLFCMVGALLEIELVWTIQDIALGLLTIPNLCALIYLWPEVKRATEEYFGRNKGITS
ncbi:MAG: sodium:alanine symporter family protein [Lachnospiraceae bacterium]|nr:sodium:alanine symporter family protein [Lachnospiraceae bacterium]